MPVQNVILRALDIHLHDVDAVAAQFGSSIPADIGAAHGQ